MSCWRVRIRGSGGIWGAGVLIADRRILTCAHVVNEASGRRAGELAIPDGAVEVDFPAVRGSGRLAASVAHWIPIEEDGCGDLAVLTLADDPPVGAVPARLSGGVGRAVAVHVVGHPRGLDDGVEAQARTGGSGGPGGEWIQLDAERVTGFRIQQGFSGAGVVDSATGAVIGIVVSEASDAEAKVAWMIPVTVIAERVPDLHIDRGSSGNAVNTLPPAAGDFVGRREELERLRVLGRGGTVVVPAIVGMGGIGKTTLAVQLAHELAPHYPDAQLCIDLQAHAEGAEPLAPGVAIARLLRTLGVVPDPAPASDVEWAEVWRAELARRSVVVVLDNAVSVDQIRHVIPGTTRSLVLVTSRNRLTGLEQLVELRLDVLAHEEARTLFARIVGEDRAKRETVAVDEVLALSGRLPLAVRLVAARLGAHPSWAVADIVSDIKGGLGELRIDDGTDVEKARLSVRAAFGLSYRNLPDDEKRLFRRLGLHPSAEFASSAAFALNGSADRRGLERLVNYSLLRELKRDRFRLHDLVHAFARERVMAEESRAERGEAVARILDYYLTCALAAHATVCPHRTVNDAVDRSFAELPDLSTPESARAWFTQEHTNLLACSMLAHEYDLGGFLWRIPRAMRHYLGLRAGVADVTAAYALGFAAAHEAGDAMGVADMTALLADASYQLGLNKAALSDYRQAHGLYLAAGDELSAADMSNRIGRSVRMSAIEEARAHHAQALRVFDSLGDDYGRAESHFYLGMIDRLTGVYQDAFRHQEQAVALYRQLGEEVGEARCVAAMGILHRLGGDYRAAIACYDTALPIYQRHADRRGIAHTLNNTASSLLELGELGGASTRVTAAIEIFREVGNRSGEADALVVSGRVHRARHAFAESREQLRQSLLIAEEIGSRGGQANALLELSRTLREEGDAASARRHAERSLELYREINSRNGTAAAEREIIRCQEHLSSDMRKGG